MEKQESNVNIEKPSKDFLKNNFAILYGVLKYTVFYVVFNSVLAPVLNYKLTVPVLIAFIFIKNIISGKHSIYKQEKKEIDLKKINVGIAFYTVVLIIYLILYYNQFKPIL